MSQFAGRLSGFSYFILKKELDCILKKKYKKNNKLRDREKKAKIMRRKQRKIK